MKGHGRLPVQDAVELGLTSVERRVSFSVCNRISGVTLAHLTWDEVSAQVQAAAAAYENPDASTPRAVLQIAATVVDAVSGHT